MFQRLSMFFVACGVILIFAATPAQATTCQDSGETFFQNCIDYMVWDGVVTQFERNICINGATDHVNECRLQGKPGSPTYSTCSQNYRVIREVEEDPDGNVVDFFWAVFVDPFTCE